MDNYGNLLQSQSSPTIRFHGIRPTEYLLCLNKEYKDLPWPGPNPTVVLTHDHSQWKVPRLTTEINIPSFSHSLERSQRNNGLMGVSKTEDYGSVILNSKVGYLNLPLPCICKSGSVSYNVTIL